MSRSAIELTRLTVNAPHAYSYAHAYTRAYASTSAIRIGLSLAQHKTPRPQFQFRSRPSHRAPYSNASSSLQASPPPPSETPAEKVARLRAARMKARMAQIPLWDRVVVEGRIWADRIHRITVYFFLLASILSVLVTVFCTADMIIWNRRKRKQYIKDQNVIYQEAVTKAIEAESAGLELTEEQRLVLGRERVRFEEQEAAERRKKEPWWITQWLFSGLKTGDEDDPEGAPRPGMRGAESASESRGENKDQTLNVGTTEVQETTAQSSAVSAIQEQNP